MRIRTGTIVGHALLLLVLLSPPLARAADFALVVTGQVKTPLGLTLAELEAMPAETVSAKDHDGSTGSYRGVSLHGLLIRAGVPQGESLRGNDLQLCVLVKAADGYQAVFSAAELDPWYTSKEFVLAYERAGQKLDAKAGPLRLVIPAEQHQARWVRQVTELEIIRVATATKPETKR